MNIKIIEKSNLIVVLLLIAILIALTINLIKNPKQALEVVDADSTIKTSDFIPDKWTLFLFDDLGSVKSTFLFADLKTCWDGAVVGSNRGERDFACGRNCQNDNYRNCDKICFKNTQDPYCKENY